MDPNPTINLREETDYGLDEKEDELDVSELDLDSED